MLFEYVLHALLVAEITLLCTAWLVPLRLRIKLKNTKEGQDRAPLDKRLAKATEAYLFLIFAALLLYVAIHWRADIGVSLADFLSGAGLVLSWAAATTAASGKEKT